MGNGFTGHYTAVAEATWRKINKGEVARSTYLGCDEHYNPAGHAVVAAEVGPQIAQAMGWDYGDTHPSPDAAPAPAPARTTRAGAGSHPAHTPAGAGGAAQSTTEGASATEEKAASSSSGLALRRAARGAFLFFAIAALAYLGYRSQTKRLGSAAPSGASALLACRARTAPRRSAGKHAGLTGWIAAGAVASAHMRALVRVLTDLTFYGREGSGSYEPLTGDGADAAANPFAQTTQQDAGDYNEL